MATTTPTISSSPTAPPTMPPINAMSSEADGAPVSLEFNTAIIVDEGKLFSVELVSSNVVESDDSVVVDDNDVVTDVVELRS